MTSATSSPRVLVLDTTLRDGEQAPGAAMTPEEKLAIARQLEALKVDIIEAGFPAASPADMRAVNDIARVIKDCRVSAFARAVPGDVRAAAQALEPAQAPRIEVVIATSEIHLKRKLRMTEDEILERTVDNVKAARNLCDDVAWLAEDCTRTDYDVMCRLFEAAIRAGASTVVIADTVGYATPEEIKDRFAHLRNNVPNIDKAVLAIHCHDDLGLAVGNSLAALDAGAREVQCTINGIGERAGNASLEEIVMAIKTRSDRYPYELGIETRQLTETSRIVREVTRFAVAPNKAVVGANAFSHGSGIHQDGVLKAANTYEIIDPRSVGADGRSFPIGRLSGRHGLRNKIERMGFQLSEAELDAAFRSMKELLDTKKHVTDAELLGLIQDACTDSRRQSAG